jgi:hypothetical protein
MAGLPGQRAVFVAGLGHSGSTLLDLMLSGHSRLVGLGEIRTLLRLHMRDSAAFRVRRCSCGVDLSDCVFWSAVHDRLSFVRDMNLANGYLTVVETFADTFGHEFTLVDSSKTLDALQHLGDTSARVSVINLIRDVRAWTVSMRDRNRTLGHQAVWDLWRRDGVAGLSRYAGQTWLAYLRFWYRRNRDMQRAIADRGLPRLRVGYERLALSTEPTMEAVAQWLDVPFEVGMLSPNPRGSHTASGNDMRLAPDKRETVTYDDRWLTSRGWALPAALHPDIMRFNAEQVYAAPAPFP